MFNHRNALASLSLLACFACDLDSELAPRTELGVLVDGSAIQPHTNDEGYTVELERCRAAVDGIEFTTDGEMHASADLNRLNPLQAIYDLAIPTAHAHPGHAAGGEVVGELAGRFVFDWRDDNTLLGVATMLHATYSGANFTFTTAKASDGLELDDPIIGHTFEIAGTATRDGQSVHFEAFIDQDEDRAIVGIPLDITVDEATDASIGLQLHVLDPIESKSLFDGIDFFAMDEDGDGEVVLEVTSEGGARLRRNMQIHDHYGMGVYE